MTKKNKHGGARPGSGPKLKYGEPTERITFNCPASKTAEFKKQVAKILAKWEIQ